MQYATLLSLTMWAPKHILECSGKTKKKAVVVEKGRVKEKGKGSSK